MAKAIERYPAAPMRFGDVGRDFFDTNFVLKDPSDPFVPGTQIPRVRPVALGPRVVGFFAEELDRLVDALRAWRDAQPFTPPAPIMSPEHHYSVHRGPKRRAASPSTPADAPGR
jgi:hypothetical protein